MLIDLPPPYPVAEGRLAPWPADISLPVAARVMVCAWFELLWLDLCGLTGFRAIHRAVARTRVSASPAKYDALRLVRFAVRDVCLVYFKQVHCLQRSAAVVRMLRRRGVAATLVIGCQAVPVASHAWVEVDGRVVWDGMISLPHYRVIDRL